MFSRKNILTNKIELSERELLLLEGKRKQLLKQLEKKGIKDKNVLNAIGKIPRHLFFDLRNTVYDKEKNKLISQGISVMLDYVYEDKALPIGFGQTISHPYTVAFQTQALSIKPGDKVLEVGTGSGYQTAVLLEMGAEVYSIERIEELHLRSKELLKFLEYTNFHLKHGDGYAGWPEYAPFDKIIVTAAAPYLPEKLLFQLKEGGKMIIPVESENKQTQDMLLFTRDKNNTFVKQKLGDFQFVPMLYNKE
ncbi:MAG: protein-L-isoaspartate(D-aspartate) O-methyltransferase [Bacteroidetes bacterium]|nr:MAG: protein-L-isoaspartate(D-aspartate) O-methyltransferase [Bacteroidota bacterium]